MNDSPTTVFSYPRLLTPSTSVGHCCALNDYGRHRRLLPHRRFLPLPTITTPIDDYNPIDDYCPSTITTPSTITIPSTIAASIDDCCPIDDYYPHRRLCPHPHFFATPPRSPYPLAISRSSLLLRISHY